MELDKMGDPGRPKTALIACMSDTDKSFSFSRTTLYYRPTMYKIGLAERLGAKSKKGEIYPSL